MFRRSLAPRPGHYAPANSIAPHAYLLAIEHPSQGKDLEFRSELPDDLIRLRRSLGAQGTPDDRKSLGLPKA